MRDIPKNNISEIVRYFAITATSSKPKAISFRQYAYNLGEFYMENVGHPKFVFHCDATDEAKDFADKKLRYHFFDAKELDYLLISAAVNALPEPFKTDCIIAIDNTLKPHAEAGQDCSESSALKLASKIVKHSSDEAQAWLKIAENGIGAEDSDEDLLNAEIMFTKSITTSNEGLALVQAEKKKRNLKNTDLKAV